ncbi:hypothetical protein GCM10007047_03650 [Cerasicoccus arenae]|uniref:Uncharacterized protein n=2 Tax=Cerasicoccus arenae TaxID=424488 RepID=A0A8J3D925_9BACT|nr:hypothetical protein GCM10007047_03650 [Cerasicoccus arenae]
MTSYKERGITVNALWLDYEGFPFMAPTSKLLTDAPHGLNLHEWSQWRRQFALNIASAYLAAPARESFPNISTLNWVGNLSYPASPIIDATGQQTAASGALFFTHSNPYAYGNTLAYELAGLSPELAADQVDQFYQRLLLQHVSVDARNRAVSAPYIGSVAWVARIVRDAQKQDLPVMSREAYRESLRHLWLRGIQGMMIFNAPTLSQDEQIAEIQDISQIWRELSEYNSLIKTGKVCNFDIPKEGDNEVVWSALSNLSYAVARVTPVGSTPPSSIIINIWDLPIEISTPDPPGKTYQIWRHIGTSIPPTITAITAPVLRIK